MELNSLTAERIMNGPVPLDDILRDSVFYPASRTDGRPVKLCNTAWRDLGVDSYVYCDFDLSVPEFVSDTRTMRGYHVVGIRHLDPSEYIPRGWRLEMVPPPGGGRRGGYWDSFLGSGGPEHRACWVVFERNADRGPEYGRDRLSVLYVCGEGLATFQQLYCSRRITPKMVCFIQCWGFAGNWTDFSAVGAPFHRTVQKYGASLPEWLCFGDCCGVHGAVRLRGIPEEGLAHLGYMSLEMLKARFGAGRGDALQWELSRRILEFHAGGREYLAVSVSHHMEFAVFDITDSFMPCDAILGRLILEGVPWR